MKMVVMIMKVMMVAKIIMSVMARSRRENDVNMIIQ